MASRLMEKASVRFTREFSVNFLTVLLSGAQCQELYLLRIFKLRLARTIFLGQMILQAKSKKLFL